MNTCINIIQIYRNIINKKILIFKKYITDTYSSPDLFLSSLVMEMTSQTVNCPLLYQAFPAAGKILSQNWLEPSPAMIKRPVSLTSISYVQIHIKKTQLHAGQWWKVFCGAVDRSNIRSHLVALKRWGHLYMYLQHDTLCWGMYILKLHTGRD